MEVVVVVEDGVAGVMDNEVVVTDGDGGIVDGDVSVGGVNLCLETDLATRK